MADFIARLKVDSKEYDSKIDRARSGLLHLEESLREAGKDFRQADSAQVKFVQDLGKMETVSRTARGQMNELKNAFTDLSVQYKRMSDLERQSPIGKAMAQSLGQLKGRIATLRTDLAGVEKQLGGMSGLGMGGALKGAFSMFGPAALATTGVMAAVGGLKKVMGDVVNINMQFEQSTAVLASIMGKTTSEISDLTAQAKQLGAATRYTAMQITELQTNLARLGFTSQEILNSTTAVQALATATGADLGEAANLAGAALRGFGLNAAEMERVASVLSVSTTKSALSFEKLATAVPIVAPVAKQFGFTIEDTVTLLAKLSDAGMDASSAATATRNIFLRMANESGKLATALGRPVHSVEEFGEALKEMRERGMSLSDILNMVGVRSTAAFAVFADNADTLKDFKQSITDCSDAMHDMESKQLNTLQGSVTIMKSAWEGLMLTFSDSNGILKQTTDALTNLLQAWTNWRKRQQGGDEAIGTYQRQLTTEEKNQLKSRVETFRKGGQSDETILNNANEAVRGLESQKEAVQRAFNDYIDALKNPNDTELISALYSRITGIKNPTIRQIFDRGSAEQAMYKSLALKNEEIERQNYIAGLVTPAPDNEDQNADKKKEEAVKVLRAQYEAEEKEQIARLDRMAMQEEDYEAKVYEIRRASM
ncbi:MAG: phage tail tape measure protein, partial [Bacteroidales bacterium]|nr:phage tail tape measure protein [Bacteroidales bacterium]